MKTLVRGAVVAVTAGLLVAPVPSQAADDSRRVATLDSTHPSVDKPVPGATGRAVLTPYPAAGKICYQYTWDDMEMRRLDLRRRSTGAPVTIFYDEAPTTSGRVSGCSTSGTTVFEELTSRRVREITQHPRRFYVLATTYTGDKIAGNLHRPGQ